MKTPSFTKPTKEVIEAARMVSKKQKDVNRIKPVVHSYERAILAQYRWHDYMTKDVILEPDQSYRLSDDDFAVYDAECRKARDAHGLEVENDGYCPLLVAENELLKAKKSLINAMEPLTGVTHHNLICSGIANYHKYIDLTLKLVQSYIKRERVGNLIRGLSC